MPERATLEDRLEKIQADLKKAQRSFETSVESLAEILGSEDRARISAAKDSMHLWNDALRNLTEEERSIQRRLDYLTSKELSHSAMKAVKSSSRAAWATFWIALLAIIASTTAAVVAALAYMAQSGPH